MRPETTNRPSITFRILSRKVLDGAVVKDVVEINPLVKRRDSHERYTMWRLRVRVDSKRDRPVHRRRYKKSLQPSSGSNRRCFALL